MLFDQCQIVENFYVRKKKVVGQFIFLGQNGHVPHLVGGIYLLVNGFALVSPLNY